VKTGESIPAVTLSGAAVSGEAVLLEEFPDRKYLKRWDRGNEHRWQFQFELDPIKESKSFSDRKLGSIGASYAAAIAYRNQFLKAAAELGLLGPDGNPSGSDLPIQLKLSPRNTSGIVGLYRENLVRKGKAHAEVAWIANYKDEKSSNAQKSFSILKLGEKGALSAALKFRRDYVARVAEATPVPAKRALVEDHVLQLDLLLECIGDLVEETEVFVFLGALNNPLVTATEKQEFLSVRIAQARFRRLVLAMWSHRCCVTRFTQFLAAGHIKPWSESSNEERVDPFNGLSLSPVYDKAFDQGLITFENEGQLRISPLLAANAPLLGIDHHKRIIGLEERHFQYLAYHRAKRFKGLS
jgi:HNH endonuclease